MARLRTFLAVPLSADIRDRLVGLQQRLAKDVGEVKWVEDENLHVTLVFLGDVSAEEIPAVCRATQESVADVPPFLLGVRGVGCFPTARRPRILWAGIDPGADPLKDLYEQVSLALETLGFRREDRPYTPHVTIGRVKGEGNGMAHVLAMHADFNAGETTLVQEVHIYSSEMTRQGSRYQVLGRAKLQG
jgi:2'-5' RNA ligase